MGSFLGKISIERKQAEIARQERDDLAFIFQHVRPGPTPIFAPLRTDDSGEHRPRIGYCFILHDYSQELHDTMSKYYPVAADAMSKVGAGVGGICAFNLYGAAAEHFYDGYEQHNPRRASGRGF